MRFVTLRAQAVEEVGEEARETGVSLIDKFAKMCKKIGGRPYRTKDPEGKWFNVSCTIRAPEEGRPPVLTALVARSEKDPTFVEFAVRGPYGYDLSAMVREAAIIAGNLNVREASSLWFQGYCTPEGLCNSDRGIIEVQAPFRVELSYYPDKDYARLEFSPLEEEGAEEEIPPIVEEPAEKKARRGRKMGF